MLCAHDKIWNLKNGISQKVNAAVKSKVSQQSFAEHSLLPTAIDLAKTSLVVAILKLKKPRQKRALTLNVKDHLDDRHLRYPKYLQPRKILQEAIRMYLIYLLYVKWAKSYTGTHCHKVWGYKEKHH